MKKWTKQFMELLVISVIFIISICSSKNMVFAKMEQNSTVEDSTINNATQNKDGYKNIEKYINDKDINYEQIQSVIDDCMDGQNTFNFREYVKNLVTSGQGFSFKRILNDCVAGIKSEFTANFKTLARIIVIAIFAAIFTNFAAVFLDNQVADTGFYITYILLFCILIAGFTTTANIAINAISRVIQFMTVLLPAYFMTVAMASGSVTSATFYEFTMIVITIVDGVLLKVIIPLIKVYLIIMLANNLSKEDMLSKLAGTIETIVKWSLKTLIAFVIGFNAIQTLVSPVADGLKRSLLLKAGNAIPGVGSILSGVAETVMGAGVLLKNAVGAAGLVVIIVVCTIPIIKLVVNYFILRIGESVIQPVSDKRVINCINAASVATNLLLQVVVVVAVLFLITLTIVTASTNGAIG